MRQSAWLALSDGRIFEGEAAGYVPDEGVVRGEFVFNTAMCGYQEVITDPSYAGQIITFTYPHLGNYGFSPLDDEATRPWCDGVVTRELSDVASSWRAEGTLEEFLRQHRVPAITGIDTRALTRHLRDFGALPGAFGPAGREEVLSAARTAHGTEGCDLVSLVSTTTSYQRGDGRRRVVAVDYGIKTTMVRQLSERFTVVVVPASTSREEVARLEPDGVFLSNGPGDPAALTDATRVVESLIGEFPIFGICLGHQLLAQALGGRTLKLPFGHHGSNHPVRDLATGRVEITAQNHNYAVAADSLGRGVVSHVNLNDGIIEGIASTDDCCFSVQYHPEAGPGPHDARYLFERFDALMAATVEGRN